jgi:hypothetical protein
MTNIKNFAAIDDNNTVLAVIVGDSLESIQSMFTNNRWIETFADVEGKILAGVGFKYDEENDNFIAPSYEVNIDSFMECGCDRPWEHLEMVPW